MSAIITLESRLQSAKEYINNNFDSVDNNIYSHLYIGRSLPWNDEYSPDMAIMSDKDIHDTLFQRILLKQIKKENAILAIRKFVWIADTIYTRADSDTDYTDYRNWIHPESPFYVINSEGNVYKCIDNNHNSPSTKEPTGQSTDYINIQDGYVWKFMFDLDTGIKDKFLSNTWIPVPYEDNTKTATHLNIESTAVKGDIPYIRVDDGGENYTTAPEIEIRGDGTGATAIAIMNGEKIESIQISDMGTGYTHAEVHVFGNGNGAKLTAMVSPNDGHGSNAFYELGAFFVETSIEINGDENGIAPITGTYRNVGIVRNTLDKSGNVITDEIYNTLSIINITNSSGDFLYNEMVIGEDSYAQGIVYDDPSGTTKNVDMYMIEGTFQDGENLHGQESGETGVYNEINSVITDVDVLSGDILYKENIIFITRKELQNEKFIFVIEF